MSTRRRFVFIGAMGVVAALLWSWRTGPVAERSGRRRTGPAARAEQR